MIPNNDLVEDDNFMEGYSEADLTSNEGFDSEPSDTIPKEVPNGSTVLPTL